MSFNQCEGSSPVLRHELLANLEDLGFFRYVDLGGLEHAKNVIAQQGWGGIFSENGRLFRADAEELTEGGVSDFIHRVTPFLELQGISTPQLEDDFGEEYTLVAGEERFSIWTYAEYERDRTMPGLLWGLSSVRTVKILNDWLEQANSVERAYGVNAGNDFEIFFLTDALVKRICEDPDASPKYGPYMPNLEYPMFGQPLVDAR